MAVEVEINSVKQRHPFTDQKVALLEAKPPLATAVFERYTHFFFGFGFGFGIGFGLGFGAEK